MARKDSKVDHLQQVRLFSALNRKELATLARATDQVTVAPGKTLCEEGRPGHEFFLIVDGKANVLRNGRKIASLGAGDYFGELALLDRGPRSATVKAETAMSLFVLGQREFSGVLDEIPGLAHKLLTTMAARLREADTKAVSH